MIARRQLPVASPISASGLLRATVALATTPRAVHDDIARTLRHRFAAQAVTLTDSGTSALTLALQLVVGQGNTVAFPAYVCVDLVAAARRANVRVRLYDVDPHTLSPDLDSVRRVLAEGVHAITVVHLYGFPADVDAVRAMAQAHGIPVIEDAAQHAGATLGERRAGSLGDVAILSFGRGKGTTGGNGGALLALDARWNDAVRNISLSHDVSRGVHDLIGAAASLLLGRPALYDIPSSIPSLHLGETVYHEASEPRPMSHAAVTLLQSTLASADAYTKDRQQNAAVLHHALTQDPTQHALTQHALTQDVITHHAARAHATHAHTARIRAITPPAGGVPGYLRFPVVTSKSITPVPALGIVRGYPRPLAEQPELHPLLYPSREPLTGARELAHHLMTLPTHHMVTPNDLNALSSWLRSA